MGVKNGENLEIVISRSYPDALQDWADLVVRVLQAVHVGAAVVDGSGGREFAL